MVSLRLAALCGAAALTVACTGTVVVPAQPKPVPQQPRRNTAVTLGIPPGHLPRPGQCRIWVPGIAPGRQRYERSRDCRGIVRDAPAGSWIVYRPTQDRKHVHVRLVDGRRAGVIVLLRVFEANNGRLVREDRSDTGSLPPAFNPPPDNRPEPRRPAEPRRREPEPERPRVEPQRPPDDVRGEPERPRAKPDTDQPRGKPDTDQPRGKPDTDQPRGKPDTPPPDSRRPEGNRPQPKPNRPAVASHGIPAGQLPAVNECRVWIPGVPPGQQKGERSRSCEGIARVAPAGSWVVYRPGKDRKHVYVRVIDARRAGVVVTVRVFDAASGAFVREERP